MTVPAHLQKADAQQKADASLMEYVPYGGQDKLRLSVEIVKNLIATRTKQGHGCTNRDALRFMAMCQAKRLNPFEQDAFLVGYDTKNGPVFSLITAHQVFLKRAELHPEFDGMKSGVIVMTDGVISDIEGDFHLSSQELVGGWATVFFKTRKYPMVKRARLDRFQKQTQFWDDNPEGQIVKCAEADALRSAFPTMCGGLYLREEIELIPSSEKAAPSQYRLPEQTGDPEAPAQLARGNDDDGDLGPQTGKAPEAPTPKPPAAKPKATGTATIFAEFQAFLDEIRCPLGKFAAWAETDGHVADATSKGSLEEFPADVLRRLLKHGRAGMTEALTKLI